MDKIKIDQWEGCYGNGWKGLITDESFSHPAKFAHGLIRRIYRHAIDAGWLKAGDTVLDPFGGVGLGSLYANKAGINYVGVELEQKFVDLGAGCDCEGISKAEWVRFYGRWERASKAGLRWCPECMAQVQIERAETEEDRQQSFFEKRLSASLIRHSGKIPFTKPHRYRGNLELFRKWARSDTWAKLLQGDSRELVKVLGEVGMVISSPPYSKTNVGKSEGEANLRRLQEKAQRGELTGENLRMAEQGKLSPHCNANSDGYGKSPGQLANLPEGNPQAVISSPPFAGNSGGRGEASRQGIDAGLFDRHSGGMVGGMGDDEDNLGNLKHGDVEAVIGSPPYIESLDRGTVDKQARIEQARSQGISNAENVSPIDMEKVGQRTQDYDDTEGQIAKMKEGELQAVIGSPPYEQSMNSGKGGIDWEKAGRPDRLEESDSRHAVQGDMPMAYGDTDGQIGAMESGDIDAVIGSPPFAGSVGSDDPDKRGGLFRDDKRRSDTNLTGTYGESEGQLGGMPVGVISSPPFENSLESQDIEFQKKVRPGATNQCSDYGQSDGQLGNDSKETFWSAAKIIVEQCHQILPVGGHAIWVVKDFVRGGKRVEFSEQWRMLCESVGFRTCCMHRAMLVKYKGQQTAFDGATVELVTARKSFFRRLAEKNGSPPIDWEIVLCMVKV